MPWRAAEEVGAALGRTALSALVNNAGIAVSEPLLQLPIAKLRQQLEVKLIGQMIVTQAFAPLLGTTPCVIKEGADADVDLLGSRPLSHPSAHRSRVV
jgi:NAD(P)-dependent dehydrogenase (short-subunit alcohol dehydrogenase family)